jgi:DNA-binding CsgD family transcriptional regulator
MSYEKIRELYEAGQTIDEIANYLEVSPTYIYTRLKKSGAAMRRPVVRRTEVQQARHNEIVKLHAQGLTPREIAEVVGLSREGVRYYLKSSTKNC